MSVPLWAAELAGAFWTAAGQGEPFPRQLRGPISRALPLAVVYLPRMTLTDVRAWLASNRIPCPCEVANRTLRGCLLARGSFGLIFIDGSDPEDEQRFSLAHELAHYLRDYWQPRRLARERLGTAVLEVFDGKRPPTKEERLDAVLANIPIGYHIHYMNRGRSGDVVNTAVAQAEEEADRLAFELLAPAEIVLANSAEEAALARLLQNTFGLPHAQATAYAAVLGIPVSPARPVLRRLGLIS